MLAAASRHPNGDTTVDILARANLLNAGRPFMAEVTRSVTAQVAGPR